MFPTARRLLYNLSLTFILPRLTPQAYQTTLIYWSNSSREGFLFSTTKTTIHNLKVNQSHFYILKNSVSFWTIPPCVTPIVSNGPDSQGRHFAPQRTWQTVGGISVILTTLDKCSTTVPQPQPPRWLALRAWTRDPSASAFDQQDYLLSDPASFDSSHPCRLLSPLLCTFRYVPQACQGLDDSRPCVTDILPSAQTLFSNTSQGWLTDEMTCHLLGKVPLTHPV